jgi:4-amino-4-deoxy-L-arabinose transferase-like glycosyltransferase
MITSPVDRSDALVEPRYAMPDTMPFEPPSGPPAGPPDLTADADAPEVSIERSRARWERPALAGLLAATAILYLWGLGASGWANSFYSAAAQAGSQSWKAFFFGSFDASSAITVDKPPASLWIMGLSVRVFGLSSWSLLVPQALMGVGTVAVVYAAVRRTFSAHAALLAGLVMATTPVAALMFRFNNPDALLVLLMTGAAYCVLRGVEDGRRRWIVWTGVLIGFGFLAKQLQVLLVLPPLALAYLVAAPHRLKRRIVDLLIGGGAMIAAAGWWIAIVSLIPASMRPYIGGSQDNSILELTLGYNGFGRLTGNETGSVGGGGNGTSMWGATGITRMFDGAMGGQIAWLIPFALVAIGVGLWTTRRAPRTDATRAAIIVWGGWLVVTALVFSFMQGIFHEYYTVALAPAIAAMVGIGGHLLWTRRHSLAARGMLAGGVVVTVLWSAVLLGRAADWNPWLRTGVVVLGIAAAIAIVAGPALTAKASAAAAIAAIIAGLAGPTAWAIETAATPHTGSIVTAGPTVASGNGGGFGGRGPGGVGGIRPGGGAPNGGFAGTPPATGGGAGGVGGGLGGGMGGGAMGGLLDSSTPSDEIVAMLQDNSGDYTWVAAAIGSNRAAGFQLASEAPVMAIGGFNGSDPSPTLEQFQAYVADGQIHYFIEGGSFGQSMGGSDEAQSIAAWVESNFTPITVDGVTLYDLTA